MKRILLIILSLIMAATLVGCGKKEPDNGYTDENSRYNAGDIEPEDAGSSSGDEDGTTGEQLPDGDGSWVIYWYLCGTDLESEDGAATADLEELMQVQLPENVTIVIETGGTSQWQNDFMSPDYLERYVYDSEGLKLIEQLPLDNMGDPAVFADFLSFASTNYPADKQMMLFWNHGGGSVSGAAFDELYDFDSLTLSEMYQAFEETFTLSADNPPFEVIGFDTCLMATIDTAYTFSDIGKYLIASEETEPGNGWYYSGFIGALAENPGMDGAELGRIICDTFVEGCELEETDDMITLSVTDLSKIGGLVTAYDNIGKEALSYACEDPAFLAELGRSASKAENYGGNNMDEGYTNMVDLGDLIRNSADILPENENDVLSALEDCVIYKVNGQYRQQASGLSCYYSYNGDEEDLDGFAAITPSDSFKYLYAYEISGELPEDGMDYIGEMDYEELPEIPTIEDVELDESSLYVDDDGYAVLDIGSGTAEILTGVYFELYYVNEEDDIMLLLGRDNDIDADWDNGVFKDNFRGVWGSIDGYLVYMELSYEGDDYNLYNVPVLLNGQDYNLCVTYSFTDEAYYILGASKPLNESGMADKNLVELEPGDTITTLHYAAPYSDDSAPLERVEVDTFTVTEDTAFNEVDMGDGTFIMVFEMVDIDGNTSASEPVVFTVEGDTITTEIGY